MNKNGLKLDVNFLAIEKVSDAPEDEDKAECASQRATFVAKERLHAHLIPEAPDIVHLLVILKANATHYIYSNSTQTEDKQWVNTKTLEELIPVVCHFLGSHLAFSSSLFLVAFRQA